MHRVWLFASLAVTLSSESADACLCDGARYAAPTQDVPLHGVVYFNDDLGNLEREPPRISWDGRSGMVATTRLSASIYRIEYVGTPRSVLIVEGSGFYLRDDWHRPRREPRPVEMLHLFDPSFEGEDSVIVALDQTTVGIRARWKHDGRATEWISIPRGFDERYISFGDIVCRRTVVAPEELWTGGTLELTALYADGSERRVEMPASFSSAALPQRVVGEPPTYMQFEPAPHFDAGVRDPDVRDAEPAAVAHVLRDQFADLRVAVSSPARRALFFLAIAFLVAFVCARRITSVHST